MQILPKVGVAWARSIRVDHHLMMKKKHTHGSLVYTKQSLLECRRRRRRKEKKACAACSTHEGVERPHVEAADLDPGLVPDHGRLELAAVGHGPGAEADPEVGGPDEGIQHVAHNPANNQRVPVPAAGHREQERIVLYSQEQGCVLVATWHELGDDRTSRLMRPAAAAST
jgi:hypothetical protein